MMNEEYVELNLDCSPYTFIQQCLITLPDLPLYRISGPHCLEDVKRGLLGCDTISILGDYQCL
jgi:hypothetical protein